MKTARWMTGLLVFLFSASLTVVTPSPAAETPAVVVGRVFYIEGDLLRYVPEEEDWVAMVKDSPFGTEDTLFSGSRGMAELIVPNGAWIRAGNNTQIQFIALEADLAEMDVAAGMARFYNKGSDMVIKVTSPFGYVLADPDTVFDFYVGESSVEVVAIKGTVSFVHSENDARYDVAAGSPSILADLEQVSSGDGTVDPDWDQSNTERDDFWAAKARVRGRSAEYLPPSLRNQAYALEENGRWEQVPYEGRDRWFWRPTTVAVSWSPFTVGHWTDWYGDQTWIPAEPFGYVTHHYGNWVYARNYWYWAPPVVSVHIGLPLLDLGVFWYPGRVSWIHSGIYVGWVPLLRRETYYSYRNWGDPHTVVVNNVNITRINIDVRNHAYIDHAIVVNQNNFYGRNTYRNVRVTNINNATIINNYRTAPVVNNTVINNYTTIKQRYNYTNATVKEKPHNSVINRIQHNEKSIQEGRKEQAVVLQERMKNLPEGKINRDARIEQPKITDYIVPAKEINRPKSEIKLQQKEIKSNRRGAPQVQPDQAGRPERVNPARPAQPEQPGVAGKPESQPGTPEQARPARVIPARPGQPERARPERATPGRPAPQEKTGQLQLPTPGPERVIPARPVRPEQPKIIQKPTPQPNAPEQTPPERMIPASPVPPERTRPDRVAPKKPVPQETKQVLPEQTSPRPERVIPARPVRPEQPKIIRKPTPKPNAPEQTPPESVIPAKPGEPERTRPERIAPKKSGLPLLKKKPGQPEEPIE